MKANLGFSLLAAFAMPAMAADPDLATMAIVRDAGLKWADHPAAKGLSQAVVYGDPSKPGMYVVRVKFAPGVMSPPHLHSEQRFVQVLKGTWWTGAGPKWDKDATTPVTTGSFATHFPNKIHYDGAKDEEVIVQISGIGPSGTTMVDETGHPK